MTPNTSPVLTFVGGAGTVTGSKTLLDTPTGRILVDCGLFQGHKNLRLQNWRPFPIPPESIDAVVITHAHIDHCGYIPRLVKQGFRGPVYCTDGTRRLCEIVLPDSGHLQEEEAEYANRKGFSKHRPAEPLYTEEDALASLAQFRDVAFGDPVSLPGGVEATWRRAGHILGAASIHLELPDHGVKVVFSGDLGRSTHPILLPPAPIGRSDDVVTESTYGDEEHGDADPEADLARVIDAVAEREGVVVVPAFAVDRTEVVLWHLDRLVATGRVPNIPVFVDSPMACRALEVYRGEARRGSPEIRSGHHGGDLFPTIDPTEVVSADDSKLLNTRRGPMIIVSASGMATGGRVVHHLAHRIGDWRNAVVLVGFQAPGTRGAALREGARQLKMLGHYHPVEAQVVSLEMSAHADRSGLLDWLGTADPDPDTVYVNHGEPAASEALAATVRDRGITAILPKAGERLRLDRVLGRRRRGGGT